jgi:dihydroxy-acid dehydratase
LAENLQGATSYVWLQYQLILVLDVTELEFDKQDVVRPLDKPIKSSGHITILRGSLAPESAVAKITGKEGTRFEASKELF